MIPSLGMQPSSLASGGEDSTAFHTLSSSLHTLSLASLRELLLSCALENEQVATHINSCLQSSNGVKTPYNLENFNFHTGSTDSLLNGSGGSSSCPPSPELDHSQGISKPYLQAEYTPNYGSSYNGLKNSGGITIMSENTREKPSHIPSWNWSYYYYKESSTGATAKRDDVDEGIYFL